MTIALSCPSCQQKYRLKDELAGKKAACAKCGAKFAIPAQQSLAVPQKKSPSVDPAAERVGKRSLELPPLASRDILGAAAMADFWDLPDLGNLLDDNLPNIKESPLQKASEAGGACPNCGKRLARGTVLCVACGHHLKTGTRLSTLREASSGTRQSANASGVATLAKGTLFSLIGALVGAGIWVGVAVLLKVEIGWIAWGLGALAGLGMAIGHDDKDGTLAGIIAGAMSLAGILAAKFVIYQQIHQQLADLGVTPEMLSALEGATGESASFGSLFSPIDGLFILLALASAYKLGSGQATD